MAPLLLGFEFTRRKRCHVDLEFYPSEPPGGRGVLAGGSINMSHNKFPTGSWGGDVTSGTVS